jgi:hypothetical protein
MFPPTQELTTVEIEEKGWRRAIAATQVTDPNHRLVPKLGGLDLGRVARATVVYGD